LITPLVNKIINLKEDLNTKETKFQRTILRKFDLNKLSKNLQKWYNLTFSDFVKELKKKKFILSLSEEAEWEDYFNEQKEKAQTLENEINKTDKEIDKLVYELYGLTENEIKIVEEAST